MITQDIGGIYSDSKCPLCNKNYVDDLKSALRCPDHPQHIAGTFKVKIRGTTARFKNYRNAKNYLIASRTSVSDGTFRTKHYELGHLLCKFTDWKRDLVKMGRLKESSVTTYWNRLTRIIHHIGTVKSGDDVSYADIHSFLYEADFSPKSKYDTYVVFKEMMQWSFDMDFIGKLPKWPPFDFSLEHDMKRRKTVNKVTQAKILHDIYLREWEIRPRLYLAIRFLATYISLRPSELLEVKEKDFDREMGLLTITSHKTSRKPKVLRLLPQDVSLFGELPRGMPDMPLFRYDVPCGTIKAGTGFGQATFYRAWKRSCKNLGITGVDLYGGTRHSSAIALYKDAGVSPEEIKRATGHKTSIAFTRYFKLDIDDVVEIHAQASPGAPGTESENRWEAKDRC